MNEAQLEFWKPYIMAIGANNFHIDGSLIRSKHYSGFDLSSVAHGIKQLEMIIDKHKTYQSLIAKPEINNDELNEIFGWLVDKVFFDDELVNLISYNKLAVTDEEYWDLVRNIWTRQEFNSNGVRKENWRKIFCHRKPLSILTDGLPKKFKAYRAGNADGFSWTLDKSVAKWFHNRFKSEFGRIPFLTKIFNKEDVIFYTNSRNEQEVVVLPVL